MKKISTVILILLCTLVSFSQVNASSATTEKGIAEAKELYNQALPLDMNSADKAKFLDQAESILKEVIKQEPGSLEAHRKLVGVYALKQDYSNGIRTMQSAINLSPKDPKLFVALATFYHKTGAFDLADKMLDQALVLDPNQMVAKEYKVVIKKAVESMNNEHIQQKPKDATHSNATPAHSLN